MAAMHHVAEVGFTAQAAQYERGRPTFPAVRAVLMRWKRADANRRMFALQDAVACVTTHLCARGVQRPVVCELGAGTGKLVRDRDDDVGDRGGGESQCDRRRRLSCVHIPDAIE